MNDPPHDLTEGWPNDPENADLARFAEELQRSLPQLPDAALQRIERRLTHEADRLPRRRWPWLRLGVVAAGILLLALAWTAPRLLVRPPGVAPSEDWVVDSFPMELARPPAAIAPERPLVRLNENQSLFID